MDEDAQLRAPRRWPLVVALLATLVWLVAEAFVWGVTFLPDSMAVTQIPESGIYRFASVSLMLAAPLAVIWLTAAMLRDRSGNRAARAMLLTEHAALTDDSLNRSAAAATALDGKLDTLTARLEALAAPVDTHAQTLHAAAATLSAAAATLTEAGQRTHAATQSLTAATPDATAQAERLTALLASADTDLKRQLAETETMLAALWSRAQEAEAEAQRQTAATAGGLDAIASAGTRVIDALQPPVKLLSDTVDAAFVRTASALDATRDGVAAQTSAMLAGVDQARVAVDQIGGEAARHIGKRLDVLLKAAEQLGAQLEAQDARSRVMVESVERSFAILDAKLGNSVATGNAALDTIAGKMTEAREAIHRLGEPIAATHAALTGVEAKTGDVGAATATALAALGSALPAALPQVMDMTARLNALHDRAHALAVPVAAGNDAIAAADARFAEGRATLDAAAVTLAGELEKARASLAEIETLTGTASLAASSQLIEVFGRVRDVAAQTAGTMRETLGKVVEEAEAALDKAGSSRAEAAFGAPVRAHLAEVEAATGRAADAAQAATERVTRRLVELTGTVATVEARIDEADAHYDLRLRDDIAKRSGALIDSLNGAAIDIAKLLAIDVSDTAWEAYLKGDKGVFARRTVRLIDGGTARAIARHYEHDPIFREGATRYIDEFETLIRRVLPDREGKALAVTLLSSDVGKLYVALAQAVERFR